ncbi:hypothetical protein ACFSQJ_18375 [Croceitalea marina]|uniref:WG repeat-containing protein n=1 Tax=Croceitalea marina TaxID=1775166 RepID=A0ABW5N165_9FLAO
MTVEQTSSTVNSIQKNKIEEQNIVQPDSINTYRNQNWNPDKGQYYFSEEFTFRYSNAWEDTQGISSGNFGFYLDPETGTVLLEKNITHFFDEMTNYIIIKPNGNYILGYDDEFGKLRTIQKNVFKTDGVSENLKNVQEDFERFFKSKQETAEFGTNQYYAKALIAEKYERTYVKSPDKVQVYIAPINIPTTALYLVETVFEELDMPVKWDYGYSLPNNHLVVKEIFKTKEGTSVGFELKSIMATEYHIQLPD